MVLQSLRKHSSPLGHGSGIVEQYVAEQYRMQLLTGPPDVPPLGGGLVVIASSVWVLSWSSCPGTGSAWTEQPTRVQRRTKALMPTTTQRAIEMFMAEQGLPPSPVAELSRRLWQR